MAPILYGNSRQVILLSLVLFLTASLLLIAFPLKDSELRNRQVFRRRMSEKMNKHDGDKNHIKISISKNHTQLKKTDFSSRNQTTLTKANLSSKNQTKVLRTNLSLKNQTKLSVSKPSKAKIKDPSKKRNSTRPSYPMGKKSSDLVVTQGSLKTKAKESSVTSIIVSDKKKYSTELSKTSKPSVKPEEKHKILNRNQNKGVNQFKPSWLEDDDYSVDLMTDFKDLTRKFRHSIVPDLEKISTTSKIYIKKASEEITRGFKPYFGKKYSPNIAFLIFCIFILVPLLVVSLIINGFKAYFSLQNILIFIHIYLAIYFSILSLSSIVTGLEPIKFFYVIFRSTYVWLQALQTFGYVIYLFFLLMYLVLVFSTDTEVVLKLLGLTQTAVGLFVGLHYYLAVVHRIVTQQPPRTNWKVHGAYATCFILICLLSTAQRRKKTYLEDGGEGGKEK